MGSLLDDFSMVSFLPLDVTDEDSITEILLQIDMAIQYGEDEEVGSHGNSAELGGTAETNHPPTLLGCIPAGRSRAGILMGSRRSSRMGTTRGTGVAATTDSEAVAPYHMPLHDPVVHGWRACLPSRRSRSS